MQILLAAAPVQADGEAYRFGHKTEQTFHVARAVMQGTLDIFSGSDMTTMYVQDICSKMLQSSKVSATVVTMYCSYLE